MKLINNLAVYCHGKSSHPAILFVHGFPLTAAMWSEQIAALQDKYYCITYDLRGLGESTVGDGQYTVEQMVDDALMILDAEGIEKAVICGLSMGGYITLRALERNPERFSGAILCDTKAEADTNAGKINRAAGIKKVNSSGPEHYVRDFLPTTVYQPSIERLGGKYTTLLNDCLKNGAIGIKGCLLAMAARTDTTRALPHIQVPVLLVCGEHDSFSSPAIMQEMAGLLPQSTCIIIPEAGHLAPFEQPELANSAIRDFLPLCK
ncbi:MAG: alpha/beta hydrolase [Ignavibacteria bacterium]|nr:alpha/beta hydrolase [Ignavibacteria bacterium]